ncbi:MAG: hypothetical protein IPO57_13075 [Rhodocyclales bacterium]|nr:hypothetical protein [Rhodocyclales bacterium]
MQLQTTTQFIDVEESGQSLRFRLVHLVFLAHGIRDVFANKNNKSLRETLAHRRYQSLSKSVLSQYPSSLDKPLGCFLAELKTKGDVTYRRFLNPHGDKAYCHFQLSHNPYAALKGLYLFTCLGKIAYVGRSYDPFAKRVDQGYGIIHPKNCFIDGQSTNCHLNSLIAEQHENIRFYVFPLTDDHRIEVTERKLIQQLRPEWNVALAR